MSQSLEAKVELVDVLSWIKRIGSDSSSTVPLLQAAQSEYGYLPRAAMDMIIENTDITGSQVYGVATFYSQFRLKPVGRHIIRVCHGTACHVTGADRLDTSLRHILNITDEEQDTAENGSYTIEQVACIGCCSQAPVLVIADEVSGNLTGANAQRALKKHAKKNEEIVAKI
ncbi:MAG TPA: NAD(P)H-dependent oxidoreductase subunit E [Candidatus Scalindua sp.]|jgi:NADH-quinone oxidoreductase subunit E|nr:NAD(P)H-dependent oxidoreductase subunit E [Candidatus Scalindua sp.]